MSSEEFKKFLESAIQGSVHAVKNQFVQLTFKDQSFCCVPWTVNAAPTKPMKSSSQSAQPAKVVSPPAPSSSIVNQSNDVKFKDHSAQIITKDSIKEKSLVCGKNYKVMISVLKQTSVPEIFVTFLQDQKDFCSLNEYLNMYGNDSSSGDKYSPVKGEIVCVKFEADGRWYRAEALSKRGDKYKVFYIDFGNEGVLSASDMRRLPSQFAVPKFGTFVQLNNIKNEDITKEIAEEFLIKRWSLEITGIDTSSVKGVLYQNGKSLSDILKSRFSHFKSSLKNQKFPPGKATMATVCWADSEKLFFQLVKDSPDLEALSVKLNSGDEMPPIEQAKADMVCSCLSSDGKWYRACIQDLLPQSCKVLFIDFGNEEVVKQENLRRLTDELFSYPVFCIPAVVKNRLEAQISEGIPIEVEVLGEESGCQTVKILTSPSQIKNLSITSLKQSSLKEGDKIMFLYFDGETFYSCLSSNVEEMKSLQELLLKSDLKPLPLAPSVGDVMCAKSSDGSWYRASVEGDISQSSCKVKFVDYGNAEVVSISDLKCLPKEAEKIPIFCVPVKVSNFDQIKDKINFESVFIIKAKQSSSDGTHSVEIVSFCEEKFCMPEIPTLPENTGVEVVASHKDKNVLFVQKVSDSKALFEMLKGLQDAGAVAAAPSKPTLGGLMSVKYEGEFCRGFVKKQIDGSKCEVLYVDYGNVSAVDNKDIYALPEKYSSLPAFSIPISFESKEIIQTLDVGSAITVQYTGKRNEESQVVKLCPVFKPKEIPPVKEVKRYMRSKLEQKALPLNTLVDVIFYHLENDLLYLQDSVDQALMAEVQNEVKKSVTESEKCSHLPVVGELLCAQSNIDSDWYRASIDQVFSADSFKVTFIDYGNSEEVPKCKLCPFNDTLCKFPILGMAVRIVGNRTEPVVLEKLYSVIAQSEPDNGVQFVKLQSQQMAQEQQSSQTSALANLSPVITKEPVVNATSRQKFLLKDQEFVNLPAGEQEIIIYFVDELCNLFLAPYDIEGIAASNELANLVSQHCESSQCTALTPAETLEEGELVLAKCSDGAWYRACIVDTEPGQDYGVLFVDYGNVETVELSNIRQMKSEFMSLHFQARRSQLAGFHMDDNKVEGIVAELNNFTIFKNSNPLRANVKVTDQELSVEIPLITRHLSDKGLVVPSK